MSHLLRAVGWRVLRQGRWSVLLRPALLARLAFFLLLIFLLLIFGITHGSLRIPVSGVARALFYPQEVHDPSLFIVTGVRLPRLLMAVAVGAMLGMAGAAMQSITRNGLADPGLLGVKEGASIVVLTQILFFPAAGMLWQPVTGMAGGLLVSALVVVLGRDFSRPRFILIGIGISWIFAAAIGVFMTTADVRQVQTVMLWMAGSLNAVSWPLLVISLCWGIPAILLLFLTARASDIALLGNTAATGLGVRLSQLTLLRFIAPVILTATCISCVGSIGFVGLMAPHLSRMLFRGGQSALLSGSAVCGGVLVLLADNVGRLAFAPLQLPAGIVISLLGGPFFLLLLWQRRDKF